MHRRDKDVFEVLVREHTAMLLTYIRATVRDRGIVDDIFQETMLTAWRRFGDYDPNRPLAHWLRGIARRLVLAHYASLRRRHAYYDESLLEAVEQRMSSIDSHTGDTWPDKIAALDLCLERLPESLRQRIRLFYTDDRETAEIAEQLNTSREAIKKRLQRARSLLAECLRQKGLFPLPSPEVQS